jgi:hypothetical protein
VTKTPEAWKRRRETQGHMPKDIPMPKPPRMPIRPFVHPAAASDWLKRCADGSCSVLIWEHESLVYQWIELANTGMLYPPWYLTYIAPLHSARRAAVV